MFREPEFFIPALIVPVFFFIVNVGALQDFAEQAARSSTSRRSSCPSAIIFAVTGISRASALVTDIQSGYFDRLLLTPIRRPMLLLGLMAADFVAIVLLAVPVLLLGLLLGVEFVTGYPRDGRLHRLRRAVGPGVRRLPLRDRAEDRQPGGGELELHPVLPVRVPDHVVPAEGGADRLAATVATYNPVTYVLDGLRSLITEGWEWDALAKGAARRSA